MLEPGLGDIYRRFAVVVHDVAPIFLPSLERIVETLAPRVGRRLTGAVVPCWHGKPIKGSGSGFGRFVTESFGEVVQHGYTHRQDRPGVLSLFTDRSDELVSLGRNEIRRRLGLGREMLQLALGDSPVGFVPPAWQTGRTTLEDLDACGFRYLTTLCAVRATDGSTIPLATWSWDWGVVASLGRAGQWFGEVYSWLRPAALPCVVVHPADVERGYLPRVLEVVDRLLARGRIPCFLSECLP